MPFLSGRLFAAMAVCALLAPFAAQARPSMALGYEPKYPPGFDHFDYVEPNAPAGGSITLAAFGTFESLNPFLLKSLSAAGLEALVFESLMVKSNDEPFSMYGLLAEDIDLADDGKSVTFRLNEAARFSDGTPVEAEDVKASFDLLTGDNAHPRYRIYWQDLQRAVVVDRRTVRFEFSRANPELHLITAELPVFSRDWIAGRAFDEVTDEVPIASGPYEVADYDLGKTITYKRNRNYWANDLNTRRGMFNFDRVSYEYYRDFTVAFEAFKAGEYDFHVENHSKRWAREYNGPQFESGAIVRELFPHRNNQGIQGFMFNLRNPLFQDRRVRMAISLAFDFEWSNKHLFYGQYVRCDSWFSNSELAARDGPATGQVREILERHRDLVPNDVFEQRPRVASTDGPGALRENLLEARQLLLDAGWQVDDEGVLRNRDGRAFRFEFLLAQEGFERILAPFFRHLRRLGIQPEYRTVDASLYQQRLRSFNYDMAVMRYSQSQSPGNELRSILHSSSADSQGSLNFIGIADPAVDALLNEVIYARNRSELVAAARALDRVLLYGHYMVPNWYIDVHRVAYRDQYGRPDTTPLYYQPTEWLLESWWMRGD